MGQIYKNLIRNILFIKYFNTFYIYEAFLPVEESC